MNYLNVQANQVFLKTNLNDFALGDSMIQKAKQNTEIIRVDNQQRYNQCPCCGGSVLRKVGGIQYASPLYFSTQQIKILHQPELWKCLACESGFVQNALTEEDARKLYSSGDAEQRWSSPNFEQGKTAVVVETLTNLLKPGVRVLDIGCSSGNWLDYAQQKGAITAGVEYSSTTVQLVVQKGHMGFSSIEQVEGQFDIITAFDLVEHLYNLPEFLDICFNKLLTHGTLVILTGNIGCISARITRANWWYASFPEHLVFPSKKYFESHPKFHLTNWIPTYAYPDCERSGIQILKASIKELLKGQYTGHHSFFPDHSLILLKHKTIHEF